MTPGGGYDAYSRLLEPVLEAVLDAEVVVENIPGAGRRRGRAPAVRREAERPHARHPHGTGLMIAPYTNPAYAPDLERDFTVLARVVDHRQMLAVGTHLGVKTVEELVALGKRRPTCSGNTGPTTINVLLSALVGDLFGIDVQLVIGFPGSMQVIASVLRGDLDGAVAGEESMLGVDGLIPLVRFMDEGDPLGNGNRVPGLTASGSLLERRPELFPNAPKAREDIRAIEALVGSTRHCGATATAGRAAAVPRVRRGVESGRPALVERAQRARRSLAPAPAADVLRHVEAAQRAVPRFQGVLRRLLGRAGA